MANWQKPETLAIWLTIGVTFVLFLVVVLIVFNRIYIRRILGEQRERAQLKLNYQKELLNDSIRVQERERNRIAADLHDGLISRLNIIMLTIHAGGTVETTGDLLKESIGLARNISHDLSPPLLNETPLSELIRGFLSPLRSTFSVNYSVVVHEDETIENETKLQIFRIVQEIISNIIKHAQASSVEITLRITPQTIVLLIADDGVGFDTTKKGKGLGQKNIELRIQSLKGKYRIQSQPGEGTAYLMFIPY